MAKLAKCVYCNIQFDREKEPFEQVSARRYAHKACFDKVESSKSQAEKDYEELVKILSNNNIWHFATIKRYKKR